MGNHNGPTSVAELTSADLVRFDPADKKEFVDLLVILKARDERRWRSERHASPTPEAISRLKGLLGFPKNGVANTEVYADVATDVTGARETVRVGCKLVCPNALVGEVDALTTQLLTRYPDFFDAIAAGETALKTDIQNSLTRGNEITPAAAATIRKKIGQFSARFEKMVRPSGQSQHAVPKKKSRGGGGDVRTQFAGLTYEEEVE